MIEKCQGKNLLSKTHLNLFLNLFATVGHFFEAENPSLVHGDLGSGELLKKISIDGSATLYAAFTRIPDPDDLKNKVDFIPLRIGYQHTLLKRFVVFGDAGAALFYFPDSRFTSFSFGAGGGYQLQFSDDYLQVTVLYNYANNDVNSYYDWFDLRLSYGFSFKVKPKQVASQ